MIFEQQVMLGVAVAFVAFVILSAVTVLRQRKRRRRSVHWFAIFILSAVIGAGTGIGLHLSGTEPLDAGTITIDSI
ncbi:MAG: hypothetical protein AAF221_02150 [Pseudomonadota bacterium]